MIPLSQLLSQPRRHDAVVATDRSRIFDWDTFSRDVAALAHRIGTLKGDRWLIADSDAYTLAVGVFAVLHAGCRPVLPANLQSGHLADLASGLDGVISNEHPIPGVQALLQTSQEIDADVGSVLEPLDAETCEIILHTSGTTGAPLEMRKPLRCFEAELGALTEAFSPVSGTSVLATVPPYHIYGLLFRVFWPLATERPFAAGAIAYPEDLLAAAGEENGATLVSSPAFLTRALPVLDLGRLKACLGPVYSSGGPLPPDTAAAYNSVLNHPVVEVYGSTETGGIAYRSVRDGGAKTLWRPLPNVEVAIEQSQNLLTVRSPFLAQLDWYETGDLARLTEDGRFELLGRADRVVKVEEQRVSLTEIEQRLSACETVRAVRVLPMRQMNGKRQILAAVIEPSEAGWATLSRDGRRSVCALFSDTLKPYVPSVAIPRRWRFVSRLPEDERGKVSDAALRSLFTEDQGRRVAPVVAESDVAGGNAKLRLQLPEDLHFFAGHFEEVPILAGVVQIDWAIRHAQELFSIPDGFRRIEALKFFKVIHAGDSVTLNLQYEPADSRLRFDYRDGDIRYSSGRVVFGVQP